MVGVVAAIVVVVVVTERQGGSHVGHRVPESEQDLIESSNDGDSVN